MLKILLSKSSIMIFFHSLPLWKRKHRLVDQFQFFTFWNQPKLVNQVHCYYWWYKNFKKYKSYLLSSTIKVVLCFKSEFDLTKPSLLLPFLVYFVHFLSYNWYLCTVEKWWCNKAHYARILLRFSQIEFVNDIGDLPKSCSCPLPGHHP